jgi:S1-C subfamily serine protease
MKNVTAAKSVPSLIPLMERLAIRQSWQKTPAKSLVIPRTGRVMRCALPVLAIFLMTIAFDIIIAVNSQRVSSVRQLRAELAKVGKRAAVLVQRQGNMIFIPLKFQDE